LDRWARDPDFWVRRSAMLALLVPLRRGGGDFERFSRYADAMLDEREFFIRKAIGWVLRETSKRRPAMIAEWLAPRMRRASGVTLREALKYLDAPPAAALDNRSTPRHTDSAMQDWDPKMKVVGRRRAPARPDLRYAAPLLELAAGLRGSRPFIPKGVHLFRSFEEADQWSLQMMTRPSRDRRP